MSLSGTPLKNIKRTDRRIFIEKGILSKRNGRHQDKTDPGFDLDKWWIDEAVAYGILNTDPCCAGYIPSIAAGASNTTFNQAIVRKTTGSAINSTATATAAQVGGGLLTSTSAAGTTITLPTATAMATQLGAVQGTSFEFIVDNTAGASTVTVAVGAGIVVAKQTSAGDTAVDQLLTVAASATVGIGIFRLVFSSATAAVLFRVG